MSDVVVSVASDFSATPGPRYKNQGAFSGESFRESCLVPALEGGRSVEVNLDGTAGYGSSFIDEAFGGLVRVNRMEKRDLLSRLTIKSTDDPVLKDDVTQAINDAVSAPGV